MILVRIRGRVSRQLGQMASKGPFQLKQLYDPKHWSEGPAEGDAFLIPVCP